MQGKFPLRWHPGCAEAWQDTWTVASEWKDADQMGEWKWVVPKHMEEGHGLKTGQDARFYSITAPLDTEVSNREC